jgi:putative hydrolase of the HAD superfamily
VILGIAFDLDDTLYLERDYVRSGFRHVARVVAASDEEARSIDAWLWTAFEAGVRGDTFDRLLSSYPDVAVRATASDLVAEYRSHVPTIALAPVVAETLTELGRRGLRLGAVTDGPPESQSAKARALGLDRWLDPIINTGELGSGHAKPSPYAFEIIASAWSIPHEHLAYVGDNPIKDFRAPRALGWTTIRLRSDGQLRRDVEPAAASDAPDIEIRSIGRLLEHLGAGA